MAARRPDWAPLAEFDPVPGRADDVRAEAAKLKQVADSIRDQVTALRRVADVDRNGALRGQYVGKLASTARSLADHLGKAEGRYRTASGELALWVAALDTAQADSVAQLDRAQQAQRDLDANTPAPPHGPPSPAAQPAPAPTAAQQAAVADAQNRIAAERAALGRTLATLHDQARTHAKNIRDACQDDGLKDSRWDRFKHTIDHWSRALSDACNFLGWIATGLAIVALFVPGLNVIALLAMGATALSLLGHTALAAAGDGSWFDVGTDAFALLTFGAGRLASRGMETAEDGLKSALQGNAAVRVGNRAVSEAADSRGVQGLYKVVDDPAVGLAEKAATWPKIGEIYEAARPAGHSALKGAVELADHGVEFSKPKFIVPGLKVLLEGDHTAAGLRAWSERVVAALGDDPEVAARAAKLSSQLDKMQTAYGLGAGADVIDKVFGSALPYLDQSPGPGYYKHTRSPFTMPIGATW